MGRFLSGFVSPMLLLTAALLNWSLISLADLVAFLFIQYTVLKNGSRFRRQSLISWYVFIFSFLTILCHAIFHIVLAVEGDRWSIVDAQWAKLIGFTRVQSLWSLPIGYFLVMQVLASLVALVEIYGSRFGLDSSSELCLGTVSFSLLQIGSHLRALCFFLLPAVQLVAGISHPTWASLPFFICSSIGLVDWSLTSNFLGLFRWWKYLFLYAAFNIILLYICQLPVEFPEILLWVSQFFGFFKISQKSERSKVCSGLSLLLFYIMLSWIRCDLIEMDLFISTRESNLTEKLLPQKHSSFIRESRFGVRHTNILFPGAVFQTFSINFFTYGFPVPLLALSFWSFHFASICAFGLLAYVGYIMYAFPSLFHLHRLNGMLLVFILFWAASTYIFNVAFTVLNKKIWKDMEIWETIGLWHYPIPGYYLLAQFGLGVLVAMGNLVNSSVLSYLSDGDVQSMTDDSMVEEKEDTKVFIVATLAWGLRKSSRAIILALIFLIATKPGIIHAVYMVFFLMYLLSHTISRKVRQTMILLCEAHFALLYLLQIKLISKALEQKGSFAVGILPQLGLLNDINSGDFLKIAMLASFCAIHNNGLQIMFSFSAIVQHTPSPPIGFSILRAGLFKSVLRSVYTARLRESQSIHERKIASYLSVIGRKFLSVYRSCGTSIAFLTILLSVYLVTPNYASFGYLFFLLMWMTVRQFVGETKKRLWFPMKVYAIIVFVFIYSIGVFPCLQMWLSTIVDLDSALGYNPEDSMLKSVWESLAVIVVMQLFSYERRESKNIGPSDCDAQETGAFAFMKHLLIWHIEKILYLALFYASLSPVSASGFLYLLGMVICSTLPKSSRIPAKFFLVYSGFLVMVEYLFQMWGDLAEMFPGQQHSRLSLLLGLQLYKPGFFGLESGLRGKVLVIVACLLQYNVFRWLEKMPNNIENRGKWDEPCALFHCTEAPHETTIFTNETRQSKDASSLSVKREGGRSHSWPSLNSGLIQGPASSETGGHEGDTSKKYLHFYFWESSKDRLKWNRKRILFLRKERLEMQKTILKVSMKFWIENMFNLFGLEINMIALLLASFTVLNAISLLYIASVAACVLLHRRVIRRLWPIFVFLFASVITLEYLAIWIHLTSWNQHAQIEAQVPCHDCWRISDIYFNYCKKCWLGIVVDDPRMLVSYYSVFVLSCFKLRADRLSSLSGSEIYQKILSRWKSSSILSDLSFETKGLWTFLDYSRLYSYCHLLDLVLSLILITGTLEYDILHLGYLGFALVFFRMRLEILKKKNKIFRYLRIYNFALIVMSLGYQSPFVGEFRETKCDSVESINKMIGLYKYDYGFRITSRSALVEIIIFMLVSLQSYMFSSHEFDYVSKYLEIEQIGAILRQQEKKAAWKTAQLRHIRKSEEQKWLRNMQVEKMKSEMLNLQIQLHNMSTTANCSKASLESEGLRRRRNPFDLFMANSISDRVENDFKRQDLNLSSDTIVPFDVHESPTSGRPGSSMALEYKKHSIDSFHGIIELKDARYDFLDSQKRNQVKFQVTRNPLISAVHLIGDGVSQVQSLGNMAVNNLVKFLKIEHEQPDSSDHSSDDDEVYYEIEEQNTGIERLEPTSSMQSLNDRPMPDTACLKVGIILRYTWSQMRSNNDIVCYCCFVLIFLWNFSILSMVYLSTLFLYALCVNTGPSYIFWVIMLIYTEVCILLQYLYQIIIQHCGLTFHMSFLQELGFPADKIMSSFVMGNLPLFLIYLFTLLQTSITARDGDWAIATQFSFHKKRNHNYEDDVKSSGFKERLQGQILPLSNMMRLLVRSLYMYWKSLTQGAETPPYFVQLSMEVNLWPEDGIQPQRIETGINKLLKILHDRRCKEKNFLHLQSESRVRVQSIERSAENEHMGLAVFEVIYASPVTESVPAEWYKSLTPATDVANEIRKAQHAGIFKEIGFPYPILSVIGGGKREIDLYAYIFCADLAVFFLIAIFYQSVIKNNSEFLEVYQLEDQFPKEFVFVLMVVFFLIVLDRIIYLCSFATGKVIFYLFNLSLFTYSVTKYAWDMDPSHRYAGRLSLRAIYLTKAISLALQAIQIRFGVPHKSTLYRQFLTSSVSKINFLGFRLYRALPFLYELRCVLDWSCTTTSLTMYDWLKLEDIHGSLFLVKCDADLNRARHQQGQKQTRMMKFCSGICLFFVMMCVIWAPMLMYSSGNPTNIANPIKDATARIDIKTASGRLTLFETTLCEKISWEELDDHISLDPHDYLGVYNGKDIQLICCQADASTMWLVPPVVQSRFIKSLRGTMDISFSWQFTRDRPKGKEVVKYELTVQDQDLPKSSKVMEVLNGTSNSFTIFNVYPRYFRVTGSGDVRFLEQSVDLVSGDLVLNRGNPEWWSFHDNVDGCGEFAGPMAIIVSEETPQGILGETLSKFSIWGLYITFVLAVGRFIRLQCADLRMRIPFENLPSCDRLLAICEDIYAARAEGELEAEEVLYWTLVKIYRSPHMLLEYTQPD
ncbi:Piezo-type mechanosensitive ion channel like [Quillaja saponaria]|uniref:Piezo-type mechanosensitive ion channel like n=1 Tax=Quillaja saponaria TaxID=32244 RepID=A0AAD7Q200_QUISA|nr:Piezo-type mechanosensitive ion channel like [Quillaja saponaria]